MGPVMNANYWPSLSQTLTDDERKDRFRHLINLTRLFPFRRELEACIDARHKSSTLQQLSRDELFLEQSLAR